MSRVLVIVAAVVALAITATVQLHTHQPAAVGTSVIGEKPDGPRMGNQAVMVLPRTLSSKQAAVLQQAYDIAKQDGWRNPEIIQGLLMQETHAGGMKSYRVAGNKGDEYYGLGQIKVEAARDVLKKWPELWERFKFQTRTDQEIVANLILNSAFNIEVTSKYLLLLQRQYGFQGRELLNAYNRGPGGVKTVGDDYHYAIGVERHMSRLRTSWKPEGS